MAYSTTVLPPGFGGGSDGQGGGEGGNAGGAFAAPLRAPFGNAALPGYAFDGAENMGIYAERIGVLGFASQGRQVGRLDQAGNLLLTGGLSLQGGFVTQQGGSLLINTTQATPVDNIPAPAGSLFASSLGGADGLYFKQSGADAQGWVPLLGPRTALFPILAPVGGPDALPIAFVGFPDTGLHSADGELALVTGGGDRLVIAPDGGVTATGTLRSQGAFTSLGLGTFSNALSVTGLARLRSGSTISGGPLIAQSGAAFTGGSFAVDVGATFSQSLTVQGQLSVSGGSALSGGVTLQGGAQIINAPGDPRGQVAAPAGSLFLSSDGGPAKTFFVKVSGTSADGWETGGGGGSVVYPLFAPQSTDGTAQYAFEGGQAGMLSPEANALALSTAGEVRLLIDAAGMALFTGGLRAEGSLTVDGNGTFAGTLSAEGNASFASASTTGGLDVGGTLSARGALSALGDLNVAGEATLRGLQAAGPTTLSGITELAQSGEARLLGTVTLSAGTRILSGEGSPQARIVAPPGSTYADAEDGGLWVKQTGTDDNGWSQVQTSGLPASAFPLQAPDGTAEAPPYAFLASPQAGLYSDGPDKLAFATGAARRGGIDAAGNVDWLGDVVAGGALRAGARSQFQGGATFVGSGDVVVGGLLHAQAASDLDGPVSAGGDLSVAGILRVEGASVIKSLNATTGIFSGRLQWADGSAAQPSFALSSTLGSGLFADLAHSGIGVSVAGTQVGYFNAAGYTALVGEQPGGGGGTGGTASSYASQTDGSAVSPAFSVNGHGGMFWDGNALGLASGGDQVVALSSGLVRLLADTRVEGTLRTDGSLRVEGASIYGQSLVIGAALSGQAASPNGALIQGAVQAGGGTVTAPSLSFLPSVTSGTGFFYDAEHSGIGIAVGGAQVGYFNVGGLTSTATGPSTPLIDLVVRSAASTHLTLDGQGSATSVPTAIFLGTANAAQNYLQSGEVVFAVKDASSQAGTVSRLYSLSAGGSPGHSLTLARSGSATPILRYDDTSHVTTLGYPVAIDSLSITGKLALATGTASAPSAGFAAAPQTGLFYDTGRSGMGVTVGGVQVGYFNASGYNPLTGGTAMNVVAPIVTVSSGTYQLTAGQSGCIVNFTATATANLPPANLAAVGTYFTFIVGADNAAASVALDAQNAADKLYFVGGTLSAGQAVTSQSARYALLTVECPSIGQWTVSSIQGVWGGNSVTVSQADTVIVSTASNNLTLDSSQSAGTQASLRLISPDGQPGAVRFASGSVQSPTDAWSILGTPAGAGAGFRLQNTARTYDVFAYTDSAGTAASRSLLFGAINLSGVRTLQLGATPAADTTQPVQVGAAAGAMASYAVTAGNTASALTLGYSNGLAGTATGGYLSTRLAQPMYFTANGLAQTAINYTATGLVGIGSASASLSALGVFGGVSVGSGVAGATAAPANGLLVQGVTVHQGNVGIGTSTPGALLCVGANSVAGAAAYAPVQINCAANSASYLAFTDAAAGIAYITGYNSYTAGGDPIGSFIRTANNRPFFIQTGPTSTVYALTAASSGAVSIGSSTLAASALGIFGGVAIGSGVAGNTAAPANGLLVQGATTFQGNVTFQGGTTGLSATPNFPLLAPVGTTATPNVPYAFAGTTGAYGMGADSTLTATQIWAGGRVGLNVLTGNQSGPVVGVACNPIVDGIVPLQLNTVDNTLTGVRYQGFNKGGSYAFLMGVNGYTAGGDVRPVGMWFRSILAGQSVYFTVSDTANDQKIAALSLSPAGGVSVGTSAAAPASGFLAQGQALFKSAIGLGAATPTAVAFLASATAETGAGDANGTIVQVSSTGKLYGALSLSDANVVVGSLQHNKFTGDGVPVSILLNAINRPLLINVGADYTRTAASAYNVANSYFWNFGGRSQSLSTLGVTGNLAIGSTVATGTAAPANGLLVQGTTVFQGSVTFQGGATGLTATTTFPLAAPTGTTAAPNVPYAFSGRTTSGLGYDTTANTTVIYSGNVAGLQVNATGNVGMRFSPTADGNRPVQISAASGANTYYSVLAGNSFACGFGYVNNVSASPFLTGSYIDTYNANPLFFTVNAGANYAMNIASTKNVGVGSSTASLSPLGVFGGATIGAGVAGTTAAPANGLLVQGQVTAQAGASIAGNVSLAGNITKEGRPAGNLTSTQTLTVANLGTAYNNFNAGAITVTLPTVASALGGSFMFYITTAAKFTLQAPADGAIISPQTGIGSSSNVLTSSTLGSFVWVMATAGNWVVVSQTGTWANA